MTTPGITPPEDVYVPGAGFGSQHRGMTMQDAKTFLSAPYQVEFGGLGQLLMDSLNGILSAVVDGIVAGAQAVGFVLNTVLDTVVGAIQWVTEGIAGLFGVGAAPAMSVGSTVADAYDKQQELIGNVDALMNDNAGFINLCMKDNTKVNGWVNKWLALPFNTYVTEHKNASLARVSIRTLTDPDIISNGTRGVNGIGNGIVFDAPGVWGMQGQVTLEPGESSFRYLEIDVRVYEAELLGATYQATALYTTSRFASNTEADRIRTVTITKPIIVPDDGKKYVAVVCSRFQTEYDWVVWGGAQWSSFSAVRHSVDTTDYNAEDAAAGTVNVIE